MRSAKEARSWNRYHFASARGLSKLLARPSTSRTRSLAVVVRRLAWGGWCALGDFSGKRFALASVGRSRRRRVGATPQDR